MIEYTPNIKKITDRNIFFSEGVTQASMKNIIQTIINLNEEDKLNEQIAELTGTTYVRLPINIYVDSYGGSVYSVLGLVGVMSRSVTPIHTYVTGSAMSAGFIILISGHKRFAYKYSTALYHQCAGGAWGKLQDMEQTVEEMSRLQEILENIIKDKTKISKSKMKEKNKTKTDWYIPSDDLLEYGIVDEII